MRVCVGGCLCICSGMSERVLFHVDSVVCIGFCMLFGIFELCMVISAI